jgi:hypothetical protein
MLLIALAFFAASVLVLRLKRPCSRPASIALFRVDEIAMSTVLFLPGACMVAIKLFA